MNTRGTRSKINFHFLIIFIFAISLTSCVSSVYKLHDGTLSKDKIAILKSAPGLASSIYVDSIDGKRASYYNKNAHYYGSKFDGSFRIELPPGMHTLSVRYGFEGKVGYSSVGNQLVTFNVVAGKVYRVNANIDKANKRWTAFVEEVGE